MTMRGWVGAIERERERDQKLEHQTSWGSEAASECGVNGKDNTFNGILLIFSYEKLNWWMGRDEARRTPAKSVNRQRQRWSIEGWNESIVTEIWQHLTFVSGGKLLRPTPATFGCGFLPSIALESFSLDLDWDREMSGREFNAMENFKTHCTMQHDPSLASEIELIRQRWNSH